MSKRNSLSGGGGTPKYAITHYFTKSPAPEKKKIPKAEETESNGSVKKEKRSSDQHEKDEKKPIKRSLDDDLKKQSNGNKKEESKSKEEPVKTKIDKDGEDDDEDEEVIGQKKKRRRMVMQDSDDEEDAGDGDNNNVSPSKDRSSDEKNEKKHHHKDSHHKDSHHKDSHHKDKKHKRSHEEPKKKKPKRDSEEISLTEKLQNLQDTPVDPKTAKKNDAKYEKLLGTTSTLDEPTVWPHNKLEFLKPDKIKDKKGRRPDHPDYDPTTLDVPKSFLDTLSPGVRQWWVLKSDNYDCVLFFKVGKFYELYHMDADIGVTELGFTYMRGEFAHSGFPEVSFDKMCTILVDRGYKVARVEQTETPDMMTERCKQTKPTKFDKVVRREICQITNRGTQVFGFQCQITPNHQPNYMLAVVEKDKGVTSRYGICYIDTSIGDFYIGEFDDDKSCSRLLTLLSHHMPVLVVNEKNSLSTRTQNIFRTVLSGVLRESLPANGRLQCSAEKTLKHLAENYCAAKADNWPLVIRTMQSKADHLGLTPNDDYKLALKALGACITYLNKCHLEEKILPMARYNLYIPPDMLDEDVEKVKSKLASKPQTSIRSHMVLDSITLSNLRITGEEHSLLSTLDNCCTKFGKRLLHYWVCSPSCDVDVIEERQAAITDLIDNLGVLQEMRALLAPMPDFERHLAQIHLFGNKQVMQNHPDGRAILFEEKQYNKKKIQNFIAILKGFEALMQIPAMFENLKSPLIKRLTQTDENGGKFPSLKKILKFFKTAFNHEEAAKSGVIAPEKGVDAEYEAIEKKIAKINEELAEYLKQQEKFFGCRVVYFGSDKKRFQLEVPESNARKAGKEYTLEGQKKGAKPVRRYYTNETKNFLKQMQQAEEERSFVLKDLSRRIFEKFSNFYEIWKQCINCVSTLDVLGSLAEYARGQQTICIPEVKAPSSDPDSLSFIDIAEGYHPCVPADTYIPNGLMLGAEGIAPVSIVTGPNMGGKSTIMRQVGLLVIMAQIGSHVPAQHCKLSIVDRIFTRLGAQDDILSGQSTFLVELNETSLILKHATRNSLVLLDELGRGTATYDGTAIAASVVNFMADLKCRTLFSTHYHNLIEFFYKDPRITLGHMACMVENEDTTDPTQETVTFLYKYSSGACPKSYGFNAAKLAGMPQPIIKRAYELSKCVEAIALRRKITAKIVAAAAKKSTDEDNFTNIKNLLIQLKSCQVH